MTIKQGPSVIGLSRLDGMEIIGEDVVEPGFPLGVNKICSHRSSLDIIVEELA